MKQFAEIIEHNNALFIAFYSIHESLMDVNQEIRAILKADNYHTTQLITNSDAVEDQLILVTDPAEGFELYKQNRLVTIYKA